MEYPLNKITERMSKSMSKYFLNTEALKRFCQYPYYGEPQLYKNCTLDSFNAYNESLKEIVNECRAYNGGCLSFLSEQSGNGKTHLAIATGREYFKNKLYAWIEKNKNEDFGYKDYAEHEFWSYYEANKPIFMTESETYAISYGNIEFKFYLKTTRLVIVDDLFASKNNENARAAMYDLVNIRVTNHNLPTIFTSNLLPEGMPDNRISSRLQSGKVLIMKNLRDYRKC